MPSTAKTKATKEVKATKPVKSEEKKKRTPSNGVTRTTLANSISLKTAMNAKDSGAVIDTIIDAMRDCLAKGEDVLISGFGKFVVVEKKARSGRNPQTGDPVAISARKVLKFRPSDILKNSLNEVK